MRNRWKLKFWDPRRGLKFPKTGEIVTGLCNWPFLFDPKSTIKKTKKLNIETPHDTTTHKKLYPNNVTIAELPGRRMCVISSWASNFRRKKPPPPRTLRFIHLLVLGKLSEFLFGGKLFYGDRISRRLRTFFHKLPKKGSQS